MNMGELFNDLNDFAVEMVVGEAFQVVVFGEEGSWDWVSLTLEIL